MQLITAQYTDYELQLRSGAAPLEGLSCSSTAGQPLLFDRLDMSCMGNLVYSGAAPPEYYAECPAHLPRRERSGILISAMDNLAVMHHSVARLQVVQHNLARTVSVAVVDKALAKSEIE